jgi:hypothetical protein
MRIALRTGGGRGVYELAGSQGSYRASELFDKEMFYELTPSLIIPGRAVPSVRQGKPRIKLNNQNNTTHLYRLLSALLLLPKPKREFKATSGDILIAFESYSMTAIKVDIVAIEDERSIVRPTELLLENFQGLRERIDFVSRMSRVMEVWRAANEQDSEMAFLLRNHEAALFTEEVNHKNIEKAAEAIFAYLHTIYDPLQAIESLMEIETSDNLEELPSVYPTNEFGEQDSISPIAARIENVRRWRKVAVRGRAGSKFRDHVKEIYKDTCLFTGQRLPKLESIASSGVDAAHILPWASFGVNTPDNGICLSKQFHWAFDSGLISFSFDYSENQYVIGIPDLVILEANQCNFSLDNYQAIVGAIPRERLPDSPDYWPNPRYLDILNSIMFT